jgi:nucleoside-diphosphate-sugar epimerase
VNVLLTGGAGYIGSVLLPKLLSAGHRVTCLDVLLFGREPLAGVIGHPGFELVAGDLRNARLVGDLLDRGCFDAVIHLAAISNDPSSDLDPELTRAVNLDAQASLMRLAKAAGIWRFVYASSASVYGITDEPDVTEDLPLAPLTLYARYKAEGEQTLAGLVGPGFTGVAVRSATVCGYSPRLRLDLTVNILTSQALTNGTIRVFGGTQQRPNIHIQDLTDLYVQLLDADEEAINGRAFNVSHSNATVMELAELVRAAIDPRLPIDVIATDDLRSYRLSARRIADVLGFVPRRDLTAAIEELREAFAAGRVPDPSAAVYRNVALMKQRPDLLGAVAP